MTATEAAAELTADRVWRFGPIPLRRVRLHPFPATVAAGVAV